MSIETPFDSTLAVTREERLYAAACHLAGLPIFVAFALANLLAPLVIWLMKKDTMPFVNEHGKESLNFQITVLIAYLIALAVSIPFMCVYIGFAMLGTLASAIGILHVLFPIIGGISAFDGKPYRYPVSLRVIK
jgi:uncharacterized Tic20 family protein